MTKRSFFKHPVAMLGVILFLYVASTALGMLNNLTWHPSAVREQLCLPRTYLLAMACIAAGIARVMLLHPHYTLKYASWLMSTPWNPALRLPLGPTALVWEDLLLVVPLGILAARDVGVSPLLPAAFYLLGYSSVAVRALRGKQTIWYFFGLVFLWSVALLAFDSTWILASILMGVAIFSCIAVAVSIQHFPWDLADSMREAKNRPRVGLAWPLDRIGPFSPVKPIPSSVGYIAAVLCGWVIYVILDLVSHSGDPTDISTMMAQIPAWCVFAAIARVLLYCLTFWPPISLRGRLMTGRLIIPGYDHVLLSPAITCVVALILPRLLAGNVSIPAVGALTVFASAAILFNTGPTLRHWQLTGHNRLMSITRREPPLANGRPARRT